MNIGIDIDDTTFITVNSMLKYADIYNEKILKKDKIKLDYGLIKNNYYLESLYGWTKEIKFDFFNKYYKNILEECIPKNNSPEIINKLKNEGNKIYFITARLTNIKNCDSESITKDALNKYNIKYDKLIINASNKLKYVKENNINIFIDDSYEVCKELFDNGIKTYLMTTKMNEAIDSGKIERVNNWNEIYEKIKLGK